MIRATVLAALCVSACKYHMVNETPGVKRDLRHVFPLETEGKNPVVFIDEHLRKCAAEWGIDGLTVGSTLDPLIYQEKNLADGAVTLQRGTWAYYGFFEDGADVPSYVLTAYYYGDWRKKIVFRDEFAEGSQAKPHVRRIVFGWADQKNIC